MTKGDIVDNVGTFTSNTVIQTRDGDSSVWDGTFNEVYAEDDPQTRVNETMLKPTGASGRFAKSFDNGAVLGSFGATLQP